MAENYKILSQEYVQDLTETPGIESVGFAAVARDSTPNSFDTAYSTDGITWFNSTLPGSESWSSVTYGDGKFVASVLWKDDNSIALAYSTDGWTWTPVSVPGFSQSTNSGLSSVAYGNGVFTAFSYWIPGPKAFDSAYSTDGVTWTVAVLPTPLQVDRWNSIAYGEKDVIISTYDPKTLYTTPSNTETIVTSIFVSNTSNSTDTYDFAVVPDGETFSDKHKIRYNVSMPSNDFHIIDAKITMSEGDSLVALSNGVDKLNITVFGTEIS